MFIVVARRSIVAGALVAAVVAGTSASSSAHQRGIAHRWEHHRSCGVAVHVDPETRTVAGDQLPAVVTFQARVNVRKEWRGTVTLSLKGLPGQATGEIAPSSVEFGTSGGTRTAELTVRLGEKAGPGTYQAWAVARCGQESSLDGFRITVTTPKPPATLRISPAEATTAPGGRASFCLTGTRRSSDLDVSGLPPHSSARFSSTGGSGSCITVTVRTRTGTPPGDYRLTVIDRRSRPPRNVTAVLHIAAPGRPFTISGDLAAPLELGAPQPLNLTFSNPNSLPLTLQYMSVAIDHVDETHTQGCAVAENFEISQFRGRYEAVIVPAGGSTSLQELGIDPQDWPQVEWVETDQNQDACLGATLTFTYTGTAID